MADTALGKWGARYKGENDKKKSTGILYPDRQSGMKTKYIVPYNDSKQLYLPGILS